MGIHAAVMAVTATAAEAAAEEGDGGGGCGDGQGAPTLVVSRNCHLSAFSAMVLAGTARIGSVYDARSTSERPAALEGRGVCRKTTTVSQIRHGERRCLNLLQAACRTGCSPRWTTSSEWRTA